MKSAAIIGGVLGALVACGAPRGGQLPPAHYSAERHLEEAARHDQLARDNVELAQQAARAEQQSGQPIECKDLPLEGVSTTGGEPLEILRPCWTSVTSPSAHYEARARRHRERAAWHRTRASALVETERLACAGLGEAEIATSPFAQREDILRVEEHREHGALHGARVVFRKLPGLDATFMHKSIRCHYARAAALGFPADYMTGCPATLPDVRISVAETVDGIVVTISSDRDEMAAAVLGLASDLTAARTR